MKNASPLSNSAPLSWNAKNASVRNVCWRLPAALRFASGDRRRSAGEPQLQTRWRGATYQTTASIFADSAAGGYVLLALLAFALGVCVTVLCFRLRVFHEENEEDSDDRTL